MKTPTLLCNKNGLSVIAYNCRVFKGSGIVTLPKRMSTGIKNVSTRKLHGKNLRLFLIKLRKNVSSVARKVLDSTPFPKTIYRRSIGQLKGNFW